MKVKSAEDLKRSFVPVESSAVHKELAHAIAGIFNIDSDDDAKYFLVGFGRVRQYPAVIEIHVDLSFSWFSGYERGAQYSRRFDFKNLEIIDTEKESDLENQLKAVEKLSDSKSEEIFKLKQEVERLETNLEQASEWVKKLADENKNHKCDKADLVAENETLRSQLADAKNMVPEREQLLIDRYRSLCEVVTHQAGATQALFNQMTYETLGEQQAVNVDFHEQQPYNEGSSNH